MINFKFLLGLIPNTSKIESKEAALIKEYDELESYKISDELKYYFEVEKLVNSVEFKNKQVEIKSLNFKNTPEFQKEQEYISLKKSTGIKNYFKVLGSLLYKNYTEIKDSEELKEYLKLEALISTEAFRQKEKDIKSINYKNSEEFGKEQEFIKLSKSIEIKRHFKIIESEDYKLYQSLNKSKELNNYSKLQKYCESDEIKNLESEIKTAKFTATPEFVKLQEYNKLKNSKPVKNYFKLIETPKYKIYKQIHQSDELEQYFALEKFANSEKVASLKQDKKAYKGSEEEGKVQYFQKLVRDKHFVTYFSFIKSGKYTEFQSTEKSGDLEKLKELETFINSAEFKDVDSYYKLKPEVRWQQRKEFEKVSEFNGLKRDKKFIQYFKFEQSKDFHLFNDTVSSGVIEKYEGLKELINTEEFKNKKAYMLLSPIKRWEQTEEFQKAEAFKKIKSDQRIIDYLHFVASKEFKLFEETINKGDVKRFEELDELVNSEKFKEFKTYMLLPYKEKWIKTEEYKKHTDYLTLKKSEKIIWYFKVVDSLKFEELKLWKQTFSEEFDSAKLDRKIWLTRYYWGDAILKDAYSLTNDKHFVTDGENLAIENSILKIITKREKASGKAWDPMVGFKPKEFEFTTGLINTGKSFRQQYGKFKAKIKVQDNGAITHSFWLVGNQIMPQIDIFKFNRRRFALNNFWGNVMEKDAIHLSSSKYHGSKLKSDFFIYELEWTAEELIWKINGLVLKREKNGIPNEPMYLLLSSGIFNRVNGEEFPTIMEIDWIRCYEKV
jgi:hypothetical protein